MTQYHVSIDIRGMLNIYMHLSMAGAFIVKGRYMSDKEARNYLHDHLEEGHKVLPMCGSDKCPDFDYFGGGCPGHVYYYDDDGKEISKKEYEEKGEYYANNT